MRRGRSGILLQWLLVTVLLCHTAFAGAVVRVSAEILGMGQGGQGGITWVAVTLSNTTSRPAEGQIEFNGYGLGGTRMAIIKVGLIPPGSTQTLNVPIPIITVSGGVFREKNGDISTLNLSSNYGGPHRLTYLYASDPSNQLTDDELDAFTYTIAPDTASSLSYPSASSTTRTLSSSERAISQTSTDALPDNWLCYTPFKTVIMTASAHNRLTAPRRQAIDTWLALGGNLILFGEEELTTKTAERGQIIRTTTNPVLADGYIAMWPHEPFGIAEKVSGLPMPYRVSTAGGRTGAFILATLFLIVVGPINYWYFSRRNDIRKLLVTVPLLSLGFCSLIAGYFVITQGFNRKGGSLSVTTVDEKTNRAVTIAKHSLLSGLYPLGGFHFSRDTYLLPKNHEQRDSAQLDLTREIVLESGLFQPGIPFDYSTIKPFTTRERMIYDAGTGMVRNGFELPVKAVALLHSGHYYTGGAAASGEQVKLEVVDDSEAAAMKPQEQTQGHSAAAERMVRLLGRQLMDTEEMEAAASLAAVVMDYPEETSETLYMALLDGLPKSAESGVEISDGRNLHLVIGRPGAGEVGTLPEDEGGETK